MAIAVEGRARHHIEEEQGDIHFVSVKEIWNHTVRVPANSEDEAIEKVKNGEGEWGRFECDHRLNEQIKVVRVLPARSLCAH